MSIVTACRRVACVASLCLRLAGGGAQDRTRAEQASQENVALKAQVNDLTQNQDALKKDLETATKEREQLQKQITARSTSSQEMQSQMARLRKDNDAAQTRLKITSDELTKSKSDLETAKKAQEDAEQTVVRLKAAEDAVTAARTKASESEKAAQTASQDAQKAKAQVAELASEKEALQKRIQDLSAELAKKTAAASGKQTPDLNK